MDALAFESHFLDHLAPVWRALPAELRGAFLVDESLVERAERLAIGAEGRSGREIRAAARRAPLASPGPGPAALVASYGDIKVGRRLGYRRFTFLEHGAGQSYEGDRRHGRHGSYAGGEDREDVELFLVPNERTADRWRQAYPAARVAVVGSPRLETLPAREPDPDPRPVVALGFHWECTIIQETRSAFGWYRSVLPEIARRFRVIGHGHPRAADWLRRHYRRAGIEWVPEFEDVCRRADLFVCDNSSALFEFAATGRPVVVLNAPWYRRNVDHGLRFWEAAGVGRQVDRPEELAAAIAGALVLDDQAARDAALRIVYTYRQGATERAASAVEEWLRFPAEV